MLARAVLLSCCFLTGLLAALVRFTEAAWQAVQQLDTSSGFQQQQQQQHPAPVPAAQQQQQPPRVSIICCSNLIDKLLGLWLEILGQSASCPAFHAAVVQALPVLIALTTDAVALLKQARALVGSSSGDCSSALGTYDLAVGCIAASGLSIGTFVAANVHGAPQRIASEEWQQFQRQIGAIEQLPVLLLQMLAHGVGDLHVALAGVSPALQGHWAAEATNSQQQQLFESLAVTSSHETLLKAMGLNDDWDTGPMEALHDLMSHHAITLNALNNVILARWARAIQFQCGSNCTSSSSSNNMHQGVRQQQQQLPADIHCVLPSHLLVPAIKVLIKVVLVAATTAGSDSACLQLGGHSAAAIHHYQPSSSSFSGTQARGGSASVSSSNSLANASSSGSSRAAAALHSQLSQAVMNCLLQTDHCQQDRSLADDRLKLLHSYGSLLIIVCQAVQSKHIATVFQSQSAPDLLISLATIEAVIRGQATHLAPSTSVLAATLAAAKPQGAYNISTAGSTTRSLLHDITNLPLKQASLLLLPFVSKVMHALGDFIESLSSQQQRMIALLSGSPGSVGHKLSARLFTLMVTTLKVSECAAKGAAAEQPEPTYVPNALRIAQMASFWYAVITHCGTGTSYTAQAIPGLLFFRATHSWAGSCIGLREVLASATESGDSEAMAIACAGIAYRLIQNATVLELVNAILHGLSTTVAGQVAAVAADADCEPCEQPPPQINNVGEKLRSLLEQEGQVRASLHSAMQLAILQTHPDLSLEAPRPVVDASVLANKSCQELSDMLKSSVGLGMRPTVALLASFHHSATLFRELTDAANSCLSPTICCNNPGCNNLTKLSEWQSVCGKACVCSGCERVRYCSRSCQKQHWKVHKVECQTCST